MDYVKYEKLIYKTCWEFKKKFASNFYDIDDLISEANLAFCKCLHTFNENQNVAFSTFLVKCIQNKLKNYARKQKKYDAYVSTIDFDDEKNLHNPQNFFSIHSDFSFFTSELSSDSQKLIDFIKSFPPELKSKRGNITIETLSHIMHAHLGYKHKEIKCIFKEIKTSL
jgi:RNA polymerase sigma factor (sigma-70 family)